jgi:hypothetical protein
MTRYWWQVLKPADFGVILWALAVFDYVPDSRMWMVEILVQLQCLVRGWRAPGRGGGASGA